MIRKKIISSILPKRIVGEHEDWISQRQKFIYHRSDGLSLGSGGYLFQKTQLLELFFFFFFFWSGSSIIKSSLRLEILRNHVHKIFCLLRCCFLLHSLYLQILFQNLYLLAFILFKFN